jgi:hypothetical protein
VQLAIRCGLRKQRKALEREGAPLELPPLVRLDELRN